MHRGLCHSTRGIPERTRHQRLVQEENPDTYANLKEYYMVSPCDIPKIKQFLHEQPDEWRTKRFQALFLNWCNKTVARVRNPTKKASQNHIRITNVFHQMPTNVDDYIGAMKQVYNLHISKVMIYHKKIPKEDIKLPRGMIVEADLADDETYCKFSFRM